MKDSSLKCFVIMPYAPEFDDVYGAMRLSASQALAGESVQCLRLDDIKGAGRISDDLIRHITASAFCIADLTGSNPNVMWEVGYAMALGKPTVFISQDMSSLPFDIRDMRTIGYDRQSLGVSLQVPLAAAIRDTLGQYQVPRQQTSLRPETRPAATIAVTGSMQADRERCRARVPVLLTPYLGHDVHWLCGSIGAADEACIEFLVEHRQSVTVVGYHSFDISERVLGLVRGNDIPFLDAQRETLPRTLQAPTERDLYFLTKADLQILLWSGGSSGTQELIDWYRSNGKDYVVGFL